MNELSACGSLVVLFSLITLQPALGAQKKRIYYNNPNPDVWHLVQQEAPNERSNGVLMFKHTPILDSQGRTIEPVIGIVYAYDVKADDVIVFSTIRLANRPWGFKHKVLGIYPKYSDDKHAVVYEGEYVRGGVKHRVLLGYVYAGNTGVEIVADATEDVFPLVQKEMGEFVKSVKLLD